MKLLLLLFVSLFVLAAYGQENVAPVTDSAAVNVPAQVPSNNTGNPPAPDNAPAEGKYRFLTSLEFILSIAVLVFGLVVIILEVLLVKWKKIEPDMFVKFIVITVIITGTLFLITAGYSNNQIAPAVGLFGTVAGYLLGKHHAETKTNENETE